MEKKDSKSDLSNSPLEMFHQQRGRQAKQQQKSEQLHSQTTSASPPGSQERLWQSDER